jgi:hypothetical protein
VIVLQYERECVKEKGRRDGGVSGGEEEAELKEGGAKLGRSFLPVPEMLRCAAAEMVDAA